MPAYYPTNVFNNSAEPVISIHGATAAGKTAFLSRFCQYAPREAWKITTIPDQTGKLEEWENIFSEAVRRMELGEYHQISTTDPMLFQRKILGMRGKYGSLLKPLTLNLLDVPGRFITEPNAQTHRDLMRDAFNIETATQFSSYSHGILLIIDSTTDRIKFSDTAYLTPQGFIQTHFIQPLSRYFENCLHYNFPQYLAVCLTKIDIAPKKLLNVKEDSRQVAESFLSRQTMDLLEAWFGKDRVNYFASSVKGFESSQPESPETQDRMQSRPPGRPTSRPDTLSTRTGLMQTMGNSQMGGGDTNRPNNPQDALDPGRRPYNIIEPVEWLIGKIQANMPSLKCHKDSP